MSESKSVSTIIPTSIPKILLAGQKRTGKTLSVSYIKQKFPDSVEITFAEPLKQACKAIFLLSDDQLYNEKKKEEIDPRWNVTPRILFQRVGDLFRDNLHTYIPSITLDKGLIFTQNMYWRLDALERQVNPPSVINISDGRLPDENSFIKSLPNSHSIKLLRDTGSTDNHKSEKIPFDCDFNIDNNGSVDDLYTGLDKVLAMVIPDAPQTHSLKLNSPWYEYVDQASKTFEGRRADNSRKYKIGDYIRFTHYIDASRPSFLVKIIGLLFFPDFRAALNTLGLERVLPGVRSMDEGIEIYSKFVSRETQQKVGVCMIQVQRSMFKPNDLGEVFTTLSNKIDLSRICRETWSDCKDKNCALHRDMKIRSTHFLID